MLRFCFRASYLYSVAPRKTFDALQLSARAQARGVGEPKQAASAPPWARRAGGLALHPAAASRPALALAFLAFSSPICAEIFRFLPLAAWLAGLGRSPNRPRAF